MLDALDSWAAHEPITREIRMSDSKATKKGNAFTTTDSSVELFVTRSTKAGAPDFDGYLNGTQVGVYIRNGARGIFMSVVNSEKGADGKYKQLATANMMAVKGGIAKLKIVLADGDQIWAETAVGMPEELLVRAGLNLEVLESKRAAAQDAAPA